MLFKRNILQQQLVAPKGKSGMLSVGMWQDNSTFPPEGLIGPNKI